MNRERNFALDGSLIPNTTTLRNDLDAFNIKLVAFIDPTIIAPDNVLANETKNPVYTDGNQSGIFIKSTHTPSKKYSNNLVGLKNTKKCVFIDWFNEAEAYNFWHRKLEGYHKTIAFDGVWTTENEGYSDAQGELNMDEPPGPAPKVSRNL